MTDDTKNKKTLTLSKNISLRSAVERDQVRQSFSHGRSKTVEVEIRRKRNPGQERSRTGSGDHGKNDHLHGLSKEEFENRRKALQNALAKDGGTLPPLRPAGLILPEVVRREPPVQRQPAADAAENPGQVAAAQAQESSMPSADAPVAQTESGKVSDRGRESAVSAPAAESKAKTETDFGAAKPAAGAKVISAYRKDDDEESAGARRAKTEKRAQTPAPAKTRTGDAPRKINRQVINKVLDGDDPERTRSLAAFKRAKQKQHKPVQEQQKVIRDVTIPETLTVAELANRMAVRGGEVIKALMKLGVMATINQVIDGDTAELICTEFGHTPIRVHEGEEAFGITVEPDNEAELMPRAPVVTVMGHVDHGKTSLLDALRETDIVSGEAGGITQHIGAYQVTMRSGKKITFIDTPGHAAFSQMRARGANLTDVVVLVVAADDSVKEQTLEAINHTKSAGVPMVVAINKIDKPDGNPDRVKQDLLSHDVVVEDFGGDVIAVPVSAKKRTGLEQLEEAILLQAEILELKANPNRPAHGVVIEAKLDKGRGTVTTVLVQRGTLKVGDILVAGTEWGRVRALVNDHGKKVDAAGPAMPVEVLGMSGAPMAGDEFYIVQEESKAREITEYRQHRLRESRQTVSAKGGFEQMMAKIVAGEAKELAVIVKADVHGSLEAITSSLQKLATDEVKVRVLHGAVGGINESDVTLAKASGAVIIGFNVRANPQARDFARQESIEIRYYSIIYNVIDDVKGLMSGLLAPMYQEEFLGTAEIREVFNISKIGKIAGCYVTEGLVKRATKVRLLRDNVVIHEGDLKTLKRFKDEVKEVRSGYECGMAFENYNDIRVGDVIECFEMKQITRSI